MAVRFVVGRAGVGKSEHCLRAVVTALNEPLDAGPLFLLVPEQASLQMEQALIRRLPRRAYLRASVVSFSTLATRIFAETGGSPPTLSASARRMALRYLVHELPVVRRAFGAAVDSIGLIREIDQAISAALQAGVSPQQLVAAATPSGEDAPSSENRLEAFAQVLERYVSWLGRERVDPAAQLAAVRERLNRWPQLARARVWVDGFSGFTGQEQSTLMELCKRCAEAEITLLLDPGSAAFGAANVAPNEGELFRPTLATHARLCRDCREYGIAVHAPLVLARAAPHRMQRAPLLGALEEWLVAPRGGVHAQLRNGLSGGDSSLRIVVADRHREELHAVCRHIRREVTEGRRRFDSFAVIAREIGPLAALVREVFDEYEIPYFLDERRSLRSHPLVRLVDALFDAARRELPVDAMVRLIRSDLTPLARAEAEELENLVLAHSLRGRRCWAEGLASSLAGNRGDDNEEGARGSAGHSQERRADAENSRFPFFLAVDALLGPHAAGDPLTASAWAARISDALRFLETRQRLEEWIRDAEREGDFEAAQLHRSAWEALIETVSELHDVLSDRLLSLEQVAGIVSDALASRTVGVAPAALNQVLVGGIERSRHPDVREAWIIAFNDGRFPARPAPSALFPPPQQAKLAEAGIAGFEPPEEAARDERLLAYVALTRASERVTISYSRVGSDGQAQAPSRYLLELQAQVDNLAPNEAPAHDPPVTLRHFAREYLRIDPLAAVNPDLRRLQRLRSLLSGTPAAARLERMLRGLDYDNHPPPVGNFRRDARHPPNLTWWASPSEVEAYLQCPFRHFLQYGLRLRARRGPQPVAWELGDAAHQILAKTTQAAIESGSAGGDAIDGNVWLRHLEDAIQAYRKHLPNDLPERDPRSAYLTDVLGPLLRERVAAMVAAWQCGSFRPVAAELSFGLDPQTAAIEADIDGHGGVALRGRIDRIDVARRGECGQLLIYDYKSSSPPGPLLHGTLTDTSLQALLYGLVADRHPALREAGRLGGVLIAPLFPAGAVVEKEYYRKADARRQSLYMYVPRGALTQDAAFALDRNLDDGTRSGAAQLRLNKAKRKDAPREFDQRMSDTVSLPQLQARLAQARETLLHAARGVARGELAIEPLRVGRTLACMRCDFATVCRFERGRNRIREAGLILPKHSGDAAETPDLEPS